MVASVLAGLLAVPAPGRAEDDAAGAGQGEDPAQARAEALFQQGAELQEEWRLEEAIAKYREALGHWQHPQIYVNLSRALEKHGDLLDAHRSLARALRIDSSRPSRVGRLDEEQRAIAAALLADLEGRLARLEVRCDTPGAEVFVDGKRWFVGPGTRTRMVLVGEHAVIAKKPGYFTVTRSQALLAGQSAVVTVRMQPDRGLEVERRWPVGLPGAVFVAGSAATVLGAVLLGRADSRYHDAASELARECSLSCEPGAGAAVAGAVREQRWGTVAVAVGGTAALAGMTMIFLNQPRSLRDQDQGGADFQILPIASPQAAGMSALWRF